jgi:hypothetical protein
MVVNFRTLRINQDISKLVPTFILIKKNYFKRRNKSDENRNSQTKYSNFKPENRSNPT